MAHSPLVLKPVVSGLPAGFGAMQAEAMAEGHRFLGRLAAEWAADVTRFDRADEALLAAFSSGVLAGIGGLTIDPVVRDALRMRRFYVRAPYRRLGIGRMLARALIERPRSAGRLVTVNAGIGSASFWESLGFSPDETDGHTHVLAECASRYR